MTYEERQKERQELFTSELIALLKRHNAEIEIDREELVLEVCLQFVEATEKEEEKPFCFFELPRYLP